MTRPLRRAHRWIWIALSALLPALLIMSLLSRPVPDTNPTLHWNALP